jgi:type IV secretory pathway VirB4 component
MLRILYEKLNPRTSMVQPFHDEMALEDVFPYAVKDHGTHLELDGRLFSFFTFSHLPPQVKHSWLKPLFSAHVNADICMNLVPADRSRVMQSISSKIIAVEEKLAGRLTPALREQYRSQKQRLEALLTRLADEEENVFDTSFVLSVSADDKEQLLAAEKRLLSAVGSARIRSRKIVFHGHDLLWYTLPVGYRNEELERRISWPMYARLIASILPFQSSEINHHAGVLKGVNQRTSTPVLYDRFDKKHFHNPNEVVLGESGSGKSYYLRLDQIRQIELGGVERIITIDPEREHRFPDERRVVFRLGSNFTTNPFHIRSNVVDNDHDEGHVDTGGYLRRKISESISFFRWIIPDLTPSETNLLITAVQRSYEDYGLDIHRSSQPLPSEFPTLTDLCRHLRSFGEESRRLLQSLSPFTDGVYADMFNGQTNWDMKAKRTVLDIHELTDEVKRPLMDLLIKDVWEEIKADRKEKKGFYFDEAHLLVDERNQQTMHFLWQLSKRIRKYNGYLVTATQNVDDFLSVGKYGSAIFNNAFIKTFFRMSEQDIDQLSRFMSFSERELKVLGRKKGQGACLHMVGEQRVEMQVIATPYEKTVLGLDT